MSTLHTFTVEVFEWTSWRKSFRAANPTDAVVMAEADLEPEGFDGPEPWDVVGGGQAEPTVVSRNGRAV